MAPRGYVLDRNGSILVDNQPGYALHLYRREARDIEASVDFAAGVLKLPRDQLRARVERGLRDPEFLPIMIAETSRSKTSRRSSPRPGASGVRHHGGAAAPLHARHGGRPCPGLSLGGDRGTGPHGRKRVPPRGLDGAERRRGLLREAPRGSGRPAARRRGLARPGDRRGGAHRGAAGAERLPHARSWAPADRRELLPGQGRVGRGDGPADRGDPRPGLVPFLRSQLVYSPRERVRVGRAAPGSSHAAPEPRHPERLLARLRLQGVPRLRGARPGARGPGAEGLLPRLRHVLRPDLPLSQEGGARLGQPARCDQGLLRRLFLQPRAKTRHRPDPGDLPRLRLRRLDRHRSAVREDGPRPLGRVGARSGTPAGTRARDLRRDRAGTRSSSPPPRSPGRCRHS